MTASKLKHGAPPQYRFKKFEFIEFDSEYKYGFSIIDNLIYNVDEQEKLLYNAQPCIFTDKRFHTDIISSNEKTIAKNKERGFSLKACMRRVRRLKGLEKGMVFRFKSRYYYPNTKFNCEYLYSVKKATPVEYQINMENYNRNFTSCEYARELTLALREAGFIVAVMDSNPNFLSSLVSTASVYTNGNDVDVKQESGEVAIAYGHGLKIGFSSGNDTLFGYSNAKDNILWDRYGEFCKWSRANEIPKTEDISNVITTLLNVEPCEEDEL